MAARLLAKNPVELQQFTAAEGIVTAQFYFNP
jgi:hypothetical protein